jgi:hypothetical protein
VTSGTAVERLVTEAAREAGLAAGPIELLRDGSHVVFRLGDGIVGRAARGSGGRSDAFVR